MTHMRSSIESVVAIVGASFVTYVGDTETDLASWVDLTDADFVEFLLIPSTLATTITVQVKTSPTATDTDEEDLTGKLLTIPADGDDKLFRIEVGQEELPSGHYYVNLDITSTTGDQDMTVIAMLHGLDTEPVTQDATVDSYIKRSSTTTVSV